MGVRDLGFPVRRVSLADYQNVASNLFLESSVLLLLAERVKEVPGEAGCLAYGCLTRGG